MAESEPDDRTVSATLPESTLAWLDEVAEERGLDREELLVDLVEAFEAAESGDPGELRADLDDLEAETRELIQDVRQRVIQVKREADAKAPAGHDHEELRARIERAGQRTKAIAERMERLDGKLDEVEATTQAGFENYEEVLTHLSDATDDLRAKLTTLASATLDVRRATAKLVAQTEDQRAITELHRSANRQGIRTATCEACEGSVDVALLDAPRCPHCATSFSGIEPKTGFFGSHTLLTGEPPALEAPAAEETDDVEAIVEDIEGLEAIVEDDEPLGDPVVEPGTGGGEQESAREESKSGSREP